MEAVGVLFQGPFLLKSENKNPYRDIVTIFLNSIYMR